MSQLNDIISCKKVTNKLVNSLSSEDKEFLMKTYQHQNLRVNAFLYKDNIITGIKTNQKCVICGKEISNNTIKCNRPQNQLTCSNACKVYTTKHTFLKKYGVEHALQVKDFKLKQEQTIFNKYGVKNVFQSTEIKERIRNKLIDNWGGYTLQSPVLQLKVKETCKTRYGQENPGFLACISNKSNLELEILNFVKKFQLKIQYQEHKIIHPFHIDIYIPEIKLGIEVNGIRWHSTKFKDKDYHLNKTNLCESKGIRLIHVWEHEWKNNQEYVKYIISCYLDGKIPDISSYNGKLPRDYFSTLDFPEYEVEEPILEKFNKYEYYKSGYIIL